MISALKYEWARVTTLRSTWWISIGSLVIGAGFTFFVAMSIRLSADEGLSGELDGEFSRFILDGAMTQFSNVDPMFYLMAYVAAIMGVLAWGHEYRHGMIRATLTAVPQRWAVFGAKFLVMAAWVSVLVVLSCALSLLFTVLWFSGLELEWDFGALLLALFKRIVYSVLLLWLAMAATVLVRHQTFSLVMLFLWPLGVENMIKLFAGILTGFSGNDGVYDATRFLPFNAGGRIMQTFGTLPNDDFGFQKNLDLFGEPLSALGGFIVFGGFTAALMAAAYWSFQKRDA